METLRRQYTADEHAQLVAAQARQAGKELDARRIAQEIALRQWCIEQAVAVVGTGSPPLMAVSERLDDDALQKSLRHYKHVEGSLIVEKPESAAVVVARDILDFITAPLTESRTGEP